MGRKGGVFLSFFLSFSFLRKGEEGGRRREESQNRAPCCPVSFLNPASEIYTSLPLCGLCVLLYWTNGVPLVSLSSIVFRPVVGDPVGVRINQEDEVIKSSEHIGSTCYSGSYPVPATSSQLQASMLRRGTLVRRRHALVAAACASTGSLLPGCRYPQGGSAS